MSTEPTETAVVTITQRNTTGIIELNRPKALNSLNLEMVRLIRQALSDWVNDASVENVLVRSSSPRGFCAGGDVRAVREMILAGGTDSADQYFTEELAMDAELGGFPKPVVSLVNGVAMGGGLGVSMHGSHRVVTENVFASMPEMAIGYNPDVGFSYASQKLCGPSVAKFLALTGYRMTPADMLWTGIATHYVPAKHIEAFVEMLISSSLNEALARFSTELSDSSPLADMRSHIEATFNAPHWALIDAQLSAYPDTGYVDTVRQLMSQAAPSSVIAATLLFSANEHAESLRAGLDKELVLSKYMIRQHDFVEGVRAVLVDKDSNPSFIPARFSEVDESIFQQLLA